MTPNTPVLLLPAPFAIGRGIFLSVFLVDIRVPGDGDGGPVDGKRGTWEV